MSATVGDFILQRLDEWGVRPIYGYPGDGINGITAGLRRSPGHAFTAPPRVSLRSRAARGGR